MVNGVRSVMGKLKNVEELFNGRHFDRGIVILCVLFKTAIDELAVIGEQGQSLARGSMSTARR
jgi:hypothetical protein